MFASGMDLIRRAAEPVTSFLFHESIYAALVFGIVWVVSKITGRRSSMFQTGLWMLVMMRLVLPVDLAQPYSGRNLIGHLFSWRTTPTSFVSEMDSVFPSIKHTDAQSTVHKISPVRADVDLFLFGIWLVCVAVLTALLFMRLHRYHRIIRNGITIETGHAFEILKTWRDRLGIRRRIKLVTVIDPISPFTIGTVSPVVVIPEALLAAGRETDLESVIGHETAHVKRWDDLWIKLQNLIQIVYFFNPVVWMTGHRLNLARECICDRLVLAQKRIDRTRYAHGLINVLKLQPFGPDCVALIPSFSNGRNSLFTRLQNMKGEHHMQTKHKIGAVCLLVGLAFVILPMAAASLPEKDEKETPGKTTIPHHAGDDVAAPVTGDQSTQSHQTSIPHFKLIMPVESGHIASGFGMRKHPITGQDNFHNAMDIPAKKGTPVMAAAEGKVVEVKSKDFDPKGYGRYVIVDHGEGFRTTYAQLDSVIVGDGAMVRQGETIGLVGESGLSKGTHLHFELRLNGVPVDPEKYIVK